MVSFPVLVGESRRLMLARTGESLQVSMGEHG
jgi:hypothetical protein